MMDKVPSDKKRPNLFLKDLKRPSEKDLRSTTLSPGTPSAAVAASLLSDSLFPPRKPKKKPTSTDMDDDDSDGKSSSGDDDDEKNKAKDPLATQVWRLYTKAKDTLPNASRMENLTWRMMAMTLNKNKSRSSAPSTPRTDEKEKEEEKMYVDSTPVKEEQQPPCSPPAPDDTTELLSSSAPPYMIDFLSGGPPFLQRTGSPGATTPRQSRAGPRNKSVFVHGSTRATTSSSSSSSPSSVVPRSSSPSIRHIGAANVC